MHLAVLRAFKKISDDDQKIYSRKLKIIKPFGDCSSNGFSIYITLYTLFFLLYTLLSIPAIQTQLRFFFLDLHPYNP